MTKPIRVTLPRLLAQPAAACHRQLSGAGRIVRSEAGAVQRAGHSHAPTISGEEAMTAPVTGVQRSRATVPQDRENPWDKAHREGRRDRMDQGDK